MCPLKRRRLEWFVCFGFILATLSLPMDYCCGDEEEKEPKEIVELRIAGPGTLNAGQNLIRIQARYKGGGGWKIAESDEFQVAVEGDAHVFEDISKRSVNPVTINVKPENENNVVVVVATAGEVEVRKSFPARQLKVEQTLEINVDPNNITHRYDGMGAGVMFYDNQFNISNKLFDWCFRDVNTQILHVLIRPDFEPVNDNDDWQVLNQNAFDWDRCERLFWICWHAKQRNPDLKVYACLYSPPAWMKANDSTTGEAGLKPGENYKLEMAEYVYAFLKHAQWKGTEIDYLCLFNEPDFPHEQDGTYYPSLAELAKTQAFVKEKVDVLIDADDDFDHKPRYVFPETLGPGSITRAGKKGKELAGVAKQGVLDHVEVWGVHDYWNTGGNYWNDRYRELREFPGVGDRPIWMTEWAQRFPRGDLASSLEYGQNILDAIQRGASAWMAFEWAHPADNQSGLISTDWGEKVPEARFWRSKSYYIFKQIANTSPVGGDVVAVKKTGNAKSQRQINTLAIRKSDKLVVHLLNRSNRPLGYDVAMKATEAGLDRQPINARITDPSRSDIELASASSNGELAPYSLLTLEYSFKEPKAKKQ